MSRFIQKPLNDLDREEHRSCGQESIRRLASNSQVISNLTGDIIFISEPVTGHNHDMTALSETETADVITAAFNAIGDKGYQGSGCITPVKKPPVPGTA